MISPVLVLCIGFLHVVGAAYKAGDWCKFGDALDITGIRINREFVDLGYTIPLGESFTIEAWIWAAEPEAKEWSTIASRSPSFWQWPTLMPNVYSDFNFQIDDHGLLSFFMGNGQAAPWQYGILLCSPDPVRRRTWTHVAVAVDAPDADGNPSGARLYLDGDLVDSDVWGDGQRQLLASDRFPLRVGYYDNTDMDKQYWNGYLDEVRFWDHARTQDEIRSDMYFSLDRDHQQGLLAYYQFDQARHPNNETIVPDSTVNQRTAVVQFDGPLSPTYYVENRVCTNDHLFKAARADKKRQAAAADEEVPGQQRRRRFGQVGKQQ